MAANSVLGASLAPVASARVNVRGRAAVAPLQSSFSGAKLSSRGEATAELRSGKAAAPAGRAALEVRRRRATRTSWRAPSACVASTRGHAGLQSAQTWVWGRGVDITGHAGVAAPHLARAADSERAAYRPASAAGGRRRHGSRAWRRRSARRPFYGWPYPGQPCCFFGFRGAVLRAAAPWPDACCALRRGRVCRCRPR
jgi:hypothetical protein